MNNPSGWGLLKSLIEENAPVGDIYKQGLDDEMFYGKQKAALDFIKEYKQENGTYPNLELIVQEIGTNAIKEQPSGAVSYWIEKFREGWRKSQVEYAVNKIINAGPEQKVDDAVDTFKECHEKLLKAETKQPISSFADLAVEVLEEHDRRQIDPDLPGISYGMPALDAITGGMQKGDVNLIVGETGSCKSYLSSFFAWQASQSGANTLIVSPEMRAGEIAQRLVSMKSKLPNRDIKWGRLSYYAREKTKNNITDLDKNLKILPSGIYTDINKLINLTNEINPDLLVVDGIYLLVNNRLKGQRWERDESAYFLLKNLSLRKDLPVLITSQYNRTNAKQLQDVRGTQSAAQVASNFFSLEYETEEDREVTTPRQTRILKSKKSRTGDHLALQVQFNFERTEISQGEVISGPDYLKSKDTGPLYEDEVAVEDL